MISRHRSIVAAAGLALAVTAPAFAVNYNVDWMQLSPTAFGSAPPFSGTYSLPGIGAVQMTYSAHPDFIESRFAVPQLQNGSFPYGSDNYAWTNQECLARTNMGYSGAINSSWFVTYTFSSTIPAGQIVLGTQGLGRRNPNPGETVFDTTTVATVLQNGTLLGDYINGNNWGATLFTPTAGMFTVENSVTGNGGADPWWNTGLAVIRIDDAVSSLTVRIDQTSGDGIGVNIGVITPEPGSLSLLGLGAALIFNRRRNAARIA